MSSFPRPATRRRALAGLMATGAGTAALVSGGRSAGAAEPPVPAHLLPASNACILTPQAVEGPFYFDPALIRADIREDRQGVPLRLLVQIVEAADCSPVPDARVDIWHADALGNYSGYDRADEGERETFLRGTQLSDQDGIVRFATIYPGWYRGRTPHIHAKVFLADADVLTTQLYFPDALSEYIYLNIPPYSAREAVRDTSNATDDVLHGSGGSHDSFCNIKEEADHYLATLIIGIDREARSERGFGHPPGPPPGGGRPDGPPPAGVRPDGPPPDGPPPGGPPRRSAQDRGKLVPGF